MEKVIAIYGGINWQKIEGRFLLGQSAAYAINSTGGEAAHTLTVNEIPSHNHYMDVYHMVNARGKGSEQTICSTDGARYTGNAGGGVAHNNMPPYKVVYIWERTE